MVTDKMIKQEEKCRKGTEPWRYDICVGCPQSDECNQATLDNRLTKQEAIREGIAKAIYKDWAIRSVPWEKTLPEEKTPWLKTADAVMKEEHSQGVVLKVDKDVPTPLYESSPHWSDAYSDGRRKGFTSGVMETMYEYAEAGYTAWEPLTSGG